MNTPNTPANGGKILTDERILATIEVVREHGHFPSLIFPSDAAAIAFARAIEADLRAPLAAPASPTVDRDAVLEEVARWFENHETILATEEECARVVRALKSAAPAPVSGAVTELVHQWRRRIDGQPWLDASQEIAYQRVDENYEARTLFAVSGAVAARPDLTVGQEPKYGGTLFNRVSGEAIPADEPVFIFRARDHYAARVIAHYMVYLPPSDHRVAVEQRARDFYSFAATHPDRMKEPDTALPSPQAPDTTNPTGEKK